MNQVKPAMKLVGRVSRDYHTHKSLTNQEKMAQVKFYVSQCFWCCDPFIHNEDRLLNENHPYPEYYSAGLFIINDGNEIKQSLIVAHGNSMEDANKRLANIASRVDWS